MRKVKLSAWLAVSHHEKVFTLPLKNHQKIYSLPNCRYKPAAINHIECNQSHRKDIETLD